MVSKLNYFIKKYLCYSSSKIKIRFNHCWNIATQLWIESKTLHCSVLFFDGGGCWLSRFFGCCYGHGPLDIFEQFWVSPPFSINCDSVLSAGRSLTFAPFLCLPCHSSLSGPFLTLLHGLTSPRATRSFFFIGWSWPRWVIVVVMIGCQRNKTDSAGIFAG
jgi:hypothetical protein